MDEKSFFLTTLSLIDACSVRGAVKGEELELVAGLRKFVVDKLQSMQPQNPVKESVQEFVQPEPKPSDDKKGE